MTLPTTNNTQSATTTTQSTSWQPFASYTVGSEINRVLVVGIIGGMNVSGGAATAVSFGAAGLTAVPNTGVQQAFAHGSWWYLINPAASSASIDVTFDQNLFKMLAVALYLSGANQTTPVEGGATSVDNGTETARNVNITTLGPDRRIFSACSIENGGGTQTITQGSGESALVIPASQSAGTSFFDQTSAGTRDMDFSWTTTSTNNLITGFAAVPTLIPVLLAATESAGPF